MGSIPESGRSLEDEEEMATHSVLLPGKSHVKGSWWVTICRWQRIGHNWAHMQLLPSSVQKAFVENLSHYIQCVNIWDKIWTKMLHSGSLQFIGESVSGGLFAKNVVYWGNALMFPVLTEIINTQVRIGIQIISSCLPKVSRQNI